jgi:hypothetical protein
MARRRYALTAGPRRARPYHGRVFDGTDFVMSWARAWDWTRIAVTAAGVLVLAAFGWRDSAKLLVFQPLGIDFLPMWSAGHEILLHPSRIYDFASLTHFQHPYLQHFRGVRPFVYPPPSLLLFVLFGFAPFAAANAIWTLLGAAAILLVMARKVASPRSLALLVMLLGPASVLVLVAGQVTFLVAAAAIAGLYALKTRPVLAGVLFGLAGAIKPQAMVLLPVAMLATREWRALGASALTVGLAVLASLLAFGPRVWLDWLAAVPRFEHFVMAAPGLQRGMITPTALGGTLHLDPAGLDTWRLAFGVGALVMAWMVFRKTGDPARRIAALLGGGLFITPYAMHYDAALLAPAAALMLTQRTRPGAWKAALAATVLLCCAAVPHWGSVGVIGFTLLAALTPETAFAGRLAFARLPEPRPSGQEAAT